MRLNHEFIFGSTGLRPVVSGVAPETGNMAGSMRWRILKKARRRHAEQIRRDAGFNGRDARATFRTA
jgi:hypothetical protein